MHLLDKTGKEYPPGECWIHHVHRASIHMTFYISRYVSVQYSMFLEEGGEVGRWSSDGAQWNRKWLHWGLRQAPGLTKCLLHTHIYTSADTKLATTKKTTFCVQKTKNIALYYILHNKMFRMLWSSWRGRTAYLTPQLWQIIILSYFLVLCLSNHDKCNIKIYV